ncbi:isoaspartyl peptidase/L-asparaginase family protein [Aureitalea marina]|uniref:Isoaspartyl peptidase n=1 Tax=Aureitalea marina TaxID=930804 RepID=A0A2S7KRE1_9FLAO|nr:isoaspartyl peptidase/L-asparaginase [Aureitalea marina]PQB05180.1 beta-aspartyl-peptidase [Aureitalea marina]
MKNPFSIAIHGGAGTLLRGQMTPELEQRYKQALTDALDQGFAILEVGGTALDAVQRAVCVLEDSPLFNAGKGSVFTANGGHEMDAAIMCGKDLSAGAVSLVEGVRNPVVLARDVMDHSEHVFLAGAGAMEFAKQRGLQFEEPDYFFDQLRYDQWQEIKDSDHFQLDHSVSKDHKFGTVGAVACDRDGHVAAATSTGGMTNKKWGRVGDSPMIGAGTYANDQTCAVSCTGSGEFFIRGVAAYDVSCLIELGGMDLAKASDVVVNQRLLDIGGDGGLIAVNNRAEVSLPFNTEGMYRGFKKSTGESQIAIYKD